MKNNLIPINVQSPGFVLKTELNGFILEKVGKLYNYHSEIISIDIMLKISHSETKENKVCEIRLSIPGNDVLANAHCHTFEEAVLNVVDIIKNRIKRKRSKIIGKRNDIAPKQLFS